MENSVVVIYSDLESMEYMLEGELVAIEDEIDILFELAQRKGEKLKRVRDMMQEYNEMMEE